MSDRCKLLVAFIAIFVGGRCWAADNPLIGSWKWDNEKTLQNFTMPSGRSDELMKSAMKARRFVREAATRLRSNMVLIYRDRECAEVIYDNAGHELRRARFPYRLVKVTNSYLIIDRFKNGGIDKIFRESNDSLYVNVRVGKFVYRDYFTRILK